ncbi:MAG: hypothetical protein JWR34_3919 [Mycobacterium sp.]|nr:hypothetical protein [Mycobacterium sp.]
MTDVDPTTITEAVEPTETPEVTPEGNDTEAQNPSREAAKWRTQFREAEAERDALAQRIEALQTRELERIAGRHLSAPTDLLTLSARQLGDFITDAGEVNPELVASVAAEVLASRPGLRPSHPAIDPTQGTGSPPPKAQPGWSDLLA